MTAAPSLVLSACLLGACLPPLTIADSGPLTLNSPCYAHGEVDLCTYWGYVCATVDGGTSCQYPEFGEACFPSVGCDPDAGQLSCAEFSVDGGPEALYSVCGTPCNLPTDCLDATTTCDQAYLPDGGSIGACQTNYCDNAFASCTVSSAGGPDGTCLPLGQSGYNLCHQVGPVAVNGSCSAVPVDGGAYLCQPDEQCSFGRSRTTLVCLAVCGGGCPAPTGCVPYYQLCLASCGTSSPDCPSPLTCQHLIADDGSSLGLFCSPP